MPELLPTIKSPEDLKGFNAAQLDQLAAEIREVLCNLVATRTAHFASNLGVVELCIALHRTFDFTQDRLIWDTGHQVYPHKLVTGRYDQFNTMRTKGGLMGYPNPHESEYDLFMTGHAGASVSTVMGLASGDFLNGNPDRHSVAVIGDGAFPSGMVFEALNNAKALNGNLLIILNDNKMSICPRVGGVADYFDRLRMNPFYTGFKNEVVKALNMVPVFGDPTERFLAQLKEGVKAGLHGGMLFEELGINYIGPIDGHNIQLLRKYLEMVKTQKGPTLLHVVTEKGHGYDPAAEDPVYYHTPPILKKSDDSCEAPKSSGGSKAYTNYARDAIAEVMRKNESVTVMTAAMCQGTKMEPLRDEFGDRFFDTGICESHTVAFAAGQAKAGLRPIVNIYSTFLQRSFDQVFQEVALQDLPVVFTMDRAGITAADGPTHHGMYDIGYMRLFPNMIVMAPGDADELTEMVNFAVTVDHPTAIRYPKTNAENIGRDRQPIELGKAEVLKQGSDGAVICYGTQLAEAKKAVEMLAKDGLNVTLVNARFAKPIDSETILPILKESPFVVTVEEAALMTGFGSALLEAANEAGVDASHVKRLGIPDLFVQHGDRAEILAELNLDSLGIAKVCRELAAAHDQISSKH
ncbi:1-deoxy-D-xylulose-5-phosphate synthase [Bremerella sp.]|uniref:1-deoxy-D-xylulose-5-phosphate synthase n=1 Tax=Bremerella sp. TaxID=2795602 RepID=UPI003918E675